MRRLVARPAADHQQPLDAMFLDMPRDRIQFAPAGNFAVGAKFGPAGHGPAADAHPVEFVDLAVDQALEAVTHAQHGMAGVEAQAHRRANCCIHPRRGRAGSQHRQP